MNLYGLIGFPLGHSFSKKYFTQKFEKEGIDNCVFDLFPIPQIEDFPALLQQYPLLKGIAVTIPYKQTVMPFLQSFSREAIEIGAVNCIKILPEQLIGYNTDVIGFEQSFKMLLQAHHLKALVLGTGGSSKAVQFALKQLNIPFLLVSRRQDAENIITYADINKKLLEEFTIIINCTPLGMTPNVDTMPAIPFQFINASHYLYDLVYTPEETMFLKMGRQNGAIVKNGYDMLILQAEENWKIWNS
ncbi:MAG: shikimate dehydrogenase [Bacteroidetes bacterium]|nr:shikimate dehydrogenase [Bacteroidota bacterium]MBS1756131.1 shikimate dehydrogenase [Bacteroidota bacterium]